MQSATAEDLIAFHVGKQPTSAHTHKRKGDFAILVHIKSIGPVWFLKRTDDEAQGFSRVVHSHHVAEAPQADPFSQAAPVSDLGSRAVTRPRETGQLPPPKSLIWSSGQ